MRTAQQPRLVGELISDDAPQRLDAVFPGNLFACFVGAPRITNRHFVDAPLVLGDLCRNLRFESKSVRLAAMFSRIWRVPSVEQSSMMITSLRISVSAPAAGSHRSSLSRCKPE